jgi:hypothetical protein
MGDKPQCQNTTRDGKVRCQGAVGPLVHLSLSPDAIARLAEIATRGGETRSGVVERLIRECEMPRPKPAGQARE